MWRDFWEKNQKWIVAAAGAFLFLTAGLLVLAFPESAQDPAGSDGAVPKAESEVVIPGMTEITEAAVPDTGVAASPAGLPESELVVYITGAVRRPGVYTLPAKARLLQLAEAAGGLSMTADPTAVNLAAPLEDGMHVHVPGKGDEPRAHLTYIGVTPYVTAVSPGSPGPDFPRPGPPGAGWPKPGLPKPGLPVDVNRASVEELTALKGIGPALAGRIVEYRSRNGRFLEIEDLLHVRGIGRKTLEQFRDAVVIRP